MKEYKEICKLSSAACIVSFDQQTSMPSNGSEYRGDVLETLSLAVAKKLKSKKFLSLLQKAKEEVALDVDKTIILNDIEESVKFSNRIPLKLHGKLSKLSSKCNAEWEKVKTKAVKSDKAYLKVLTEMVKTIKETIKYANQGEFETSYDYLLNGYSKGFTSTNIEEIFNKLKPILISYLSKFEAKEDKHFNAELHEVMGVGNHIANCIIGDSSSFKLQKSTHPFCSTLGLNDVRITTRYKQGNILDSIGSVCHEAGHATYELGLPKEHYDTVLGSAASIACHEGISLFYEKHVGESKEMIKTISEEFDFVESDVLDWMRNVDPTNPIRTESDELTYQLHIINRFTIEKELFNGDLEVKDIPKRWNELYGKEFTPEIGYSQDVHWSHCSFGYFPSYTLGHLIAAQLRKKMESEIKLFEDGKINFNEIREWLTNNYFKHGGRYKSNELVKIATGEELNPENWLEYIKNKFNIEGE